MFTLGQNELVQIEMRRHWFILFAEMFGYAIVYLIPFGIYITLSRYGVPLSGGETFSLIITPALITFLAAAWTLIIWMRIIGIWTDYYLDVWVVTDKRIIDLEQKGLFHRKSSVFRIERIQDVTVEIRGVIATFLHFGDIHVQTAGESQEFIMRGIAHPKHVRTVILEQLDLVTESPSKIPEGNKDTSN